MKTRIFYFSATGNSLVAARTIAGQLSDAEIIAIPKALSGLINTDSNSIGIIFPVYAWGLPRMVEEFLSKLKPDQNRYVFAIATCGGTPAGALGLLKNILNKNGTNLNASFLLKEDFRLEGDHKPALVNLWNTGGIKPLSLKERLSEIIDIIKNKKNHQPEVSSRIAGILGNALHKIAAKRYKTGDLNYRLDDKCDLCGVCTMVCPRENIRIENGKIFWNHDCEMCYGCYHWCPRNAIHFPDDSGLKPGYHNPEITLSDVILR